MNIAKELSELFKGQDRAYGTYKLPVNGAAKKKQVGEAKTIYRDLTQVEWIEHVDGVRGLGVIPINDDSCCYFGAIDIDEYPVDYERIITAVHENGFPLVPCRTKSGGLHLYLFVSQPVPAGDMRDKLYSMASMLGYGTAEIFPKQVSVMAEKNDFGSWINMPYFDAEKTQRFGFNYEVKELPVEEFIEFACYQRMTAADFKAYSIAVVKTIEDGPPCLQTIITKGVGEGSRNEVMFNLALYLKKSNPDGWELMVDDYNARYFEPKLQSTEIAGIISSVKKNQDYKFACGQPYLQRHCNAIECRMREFGVGQLSGMPQMLGLTKFDSIPPIWFLDFEGDLRMELSTDELQSQPKFQRRCMDSLNIMPPPMKTKDWQGMIQKLLQEVRVIEVPITASPKGMLLEYLETYCTSRAQARNKDELLLGKPWTDGGYHHININKFMEYLERQRFKDFKVHQVASFLRDRGGESIKYNLKGKGMAVWRIPEFNAQTEDFDTIEVSDQEVI